MRTTKQKIHLSFNLTLFGSIVLYIVFLFGFKTTYNRECKILSRYETGHDYKSRHYTDYFITVRWSDGNKESETFEVQGSTFVESKVGDTLFFKRRKLDLNWMDNSLISVITLFVSLCLWAFSGLNALYNLDSENFF